MHRQALSVHLVVYSTHCIVASQLQVFLPLFLLILFQNAESKFIRTENLGWHDQELISGSWAESPGSFLPLACTTKLLNHSWVLFDTGGYLFLCLECFLLHAHMYIIVQACVVSFKFQVIIVVITFEVCRIVWHVNECIVVYWIFINIDVLIVFIGEYGKPH